MKKQINRAVLKIKPWNISQTFLPGCGCKACYHSEVSKQVTLKETSPFSYRAPLLPWGPHFAGPGTKPEAGAGGSTGDTSHQVLSLSACLGNEGKPKVITLLTTHSLSGEALLHTAFNKGHSQCTAAWCLHMQAERLWEAVTGNKGEKEGYSGEILLCTFTKKRKSSKYFGYLQVLCLSVYGNRRENRVTEMRAVSTRTALVFNIKQLPRWDHQPWWCLCRKVLVLPMGCGRESFT